MELNGIDIEAIVRNAMNAIAKEHTTLLSGTQNERGKVAAIFTGYVPAPEKCRELLVRTFGNGIDCLLLGGCEFSGAGLSPVRLESPERELFARLERAEEVALVAPPLKLLREIAAGEDETIVARGVLRSLLWGARVSAVLDFEPPRFARDTFFEKIVDTLDALKGMDVRILTYGWREKEDASMLSLITEQDVLEAHREGKKTLVCTKDALITPLGRDTARDLGVKLAKSGR